MSPSFDKINYAIRPNKNVERKMIAEALRALEGRFSVSDYCYVGLGSMWFTDFLLFHRWLSIDEMISIEEDGARKTRLEFNKPFACVKLEIGKTSKVLPRLKWSKRRAFVWLDYDDQLSASMFEDARTICESALSGSILLITFNGRTERLTVDPDSADPIEADVGLRQIAGDLVPAGLSKRDITPAKFPAVAADLLFRQFDHALLKAGRSERFVPLFHMVYNDGAPMVTVGGVIASEGDQQALAEAALQTRFEFVSGESPYSIDVPPLTTKEKLAFDQFLPRQDPPTAAELGFFLTPTQIKAYYRLYRFYPVFGEWHP